MIQPNSAPHSPAHLAATLVGTKWHANYNTFLCFNDHKHTLAQGNLTSPLTRAIIARAPALTHPYGGMSVDGILVLGKPHHSTAPEELTLPLIIINRDGSIAQNCLNGLRVAARAFYQDPSWTGAQPDRPQHPPLKLAVFSGQTYPCSVSSSNTDAATPAVSIHCHLEALYPQKLQLTAAEIVTAAREFMLASGWITPTTLDYVGCYDVGNQHLVWLMHERSSSQLITSDRATSTILGKLHHHLCQLLGGDHLNVHLCYKLPQDTPASSTAATSPARCYIASWERGVGRTQSCGSGTVAAAICYHEFISKDGPQAAPDAPTHSASTLIFTGDHPEHQLITDVCHNPRMQPPWSARLTGTATYIAKVELNLA